MEPYGIALIGCGTVGTGVARLLLEHPERLAARAGRPIVLKRVVVRDPARERDVRLPPELVTTDLRKVLDDPSIECAVEVVGGVKRQPEPSEAATELVLHRSPPLATVVSFVNKPSDNELADSVIWTCGQELYGGERSNPIGVRAMEAFLDKVGIERGTYRLDNGSGLSHTNHLSSRQLVQAGSSSLAPIGQSSGSGAVTQHWLRQLCQMQVS